MDFRFLGPVELWNGDQQVPLGGAKPRALLATLVLDAGRVVTIERLIDVVWGEEAPDTARAVLQTYVSFLRRSATRAGLPAIIVSHPVGYRADVPSDAIDLVVFERYVAEGRQAAKAGDDEAAYTLFRAGLDLWRGTALGGVGSAFLHAEARRLDELKLTVTEERIAAELRLGRHEALVSELTELVTRNPIHEGLRGRLMSALYRTGRQGDALAVFRDGREVLAAELGIDPGPELRGLHEAILRSDPALLGGAPVARPREEPATKVAVTRPRQLPPTTPDFCGRADELAVLREALTRPSTMPICVISGVAGAGKSALALQVAHDVVQHYPDGQLHVALRGMTDVPATASEVLGRLLRELGVPPLELPATEEERGNMYRTLLSGRRLLVVLDDAASERQVRPLLPGAPGCAVLISSRNRLVGLAGAVLVDLGVLGPEAAMSLLSQIVGPHRIAAEREVAHQLVRQCGFLPLAIRIAGARLAVRRQWSVEFLARRLADERQRLDELAIGDQEIRASIELSYEQLSEPAKAMLRHLGLLGFPDFPAWVAATATGIGHGAAERVLEQLADASLVEVEAVDRFGQPRYRLHDLIRLFARERAERDDSPGERTAVTLRVLGGWLWFLERINVAHPPGIIAMRVGRSPVTPLNLDVIDAVTADPHAWFRIEEENLVAAVELAAATDLDQMAVDLASVVCNSVFLVRNIFAAWQRVHDAALDAARRMGNALGEATLLAELGQLRYEQDRFPEAHQNLSQALSMYRAVRDVQGEGATLAQLGTACRDQGYFPEALHFLGQAESIWRAQRNHPALAYTLRLIGSTHLEQGAYDAALDALSSARDLFRGIADVRGEGLALRTMALYHLARGEHGPAEERSLEALRCFRGLGDRLLETYATRTWAKAQIRLGRTAVAREPLEQGLDTLRDLRDRWGQAHNLRVLGQLHLAEERLDQAEACLTEAVRTWETLGLPLLRARALRDMSILHARRGDEAAAHAVRAEAIEVFRRYGSREYRELAP